VPWQPLPSGDHPEGGPAPLRAGLDRLVRNLGAPSADTISGVFSRWPEVVGERLAAHTRPLAVRDGSLVVAVDDPAWAPQIRFLEAEVVAKVRQVLAVDDVERLVVRVRPAPS
jgi:predicted nucleic acid-binding Zn ribbon protein